MKKRHIISLFLLMLALLPSRAQNGVGSWKLFQSFGTVDKVIDTPRTVYFTTNSQLYSRSKDTDEIYNFSTGGLLSDSGISGLWYNAGKDYLIVVYENANIDLLDRDGLVYNMPDIKDATLDVVPKVNDIDFDGDKIYVATNFGVVVFDSERHEVVTSGNYGMNMTSVMVLGDRLWLVQGYIFYSADKNKSLTSQSSITRNENGYTCSELLSLTDDRAVLIADSGKLITFLNCKDGVATFEESAVNDASSSIRNITRLADGSVMCHSNTAIYIVGKDGSISTAPIAGTPLETLKKGSSFEVKNISSATGLDELWMGSDEGLSCYAINNGDLEVLSESYRPADALTFPLVGRLVTGPSGAVYASSHGFSLIIGEQVNPGNTGDELFYINRISGNDIEDITPVAYDTKNQNHKPYSANPVGFKSGYMVREDPHDPEGYVVASFWDGFYYFKNREQVQHYTDENSTLQSVNNGYRLQADGMDFDRRGNLWTAILRVNDDKKQFNMLPASKVGQPTTAADWQQLSFITTSQHDGKMVACRHSDNVFYIDGTYKSPVTVIKTRGTDTLGDDVAYSSAELIDQDGLSYTYNYIISIAEDNKGRVWIGTDNGVIEITRPDDISSNTFSINHIKVPRRDGTNFADYLLNGESVYDIAVDPSGRKWLATARSGVYLVSENGDEILEHFDPTNSPLPSNTVFAVTCGPANDVYFGTATGLYRYDSTSAPASDDFSGVYAYPNPVRPDYTGWITITGLMDNSLVKIADAAGNVFHQGTSEGGMMVWDGCDRQGRRVRTGVYYVFASQGGEGQQSAGAVTKILVVN